MTPAPPWEWGWASRMSLGRAAAVGTGSPQPRDRTAQGGREIVGDQEGRSWAELVGEIAPTWLSADSVPSATGQRPRGPSGLVLKPHLQEETTSTPVYRRPREMKGLIQGLTGRTRRSLWRENVMVMSLTAPSGLPGAESLPPRHSLASHA